MSHEIVTERPPERAPTNAEASAVMMAAARRDPSTRRAVEQMYNSGTPELRARLDAADLRAWRGTEPPVVDTATAQSLNLAQSLGEFNGQPLREVWVRTDARIGRQHSVFFGSVEQMTAPFKAPVRRLAAIDEGASGRGLIKFPPLLKMEAQWALAKAQREAQLYGAVA